MPMMRLQAAGAFARAVSAYIICAVLALAGERCRALDRKGALNAASGRKSSAERCVCAPQPCSMGGMPGGRTVQAASAACSRRQQPPTPMPQCAE